MSTALTVPVSDWAPADRAAWQRASVFDLFDAGPGAHWSKATRQKVERGVGRFMMHTGQRSLLGLIENVEQLQGCAGNYVAALQAVNAPYTVLNRVQELELALRVMAPHYDRRWLVALYARLRGRVRPSHDKRQRVRPVADLLRLGWELAERAEAAGRVPLLKRAVIHRTGLMIALLACRPIRMSNLRAMSLGKSMVNRDGQWWLLFAAEQTKARQSIEVAVPDALTPMVHRYVEHWRPILLSRGGRMAASDTPAFWVSREGTPMSAETIHNRIAKATLARFGVRIGPHLFRDCAATSIAIEDPRHVGIVKSVLQHGDVRTGERHYNQARGIEAHRHYGANLVAMLGQARNG